MLFRAPPPLWALALRRTPLLLMVLAVGTLVSCGGCNSPKKSQQANQQNAEAPGEKKKKRPLEIGPLLPRLGPPVQDDPGVRNAEVGPQLLVKPGHWTTTFQKMKANYDDFVGRSTTTLLDERNRPTILRHTRYTYETARTVVLAKGRAKRVEGELFVPEHTTAKGVRAQLINRDTGREAGTKALRLLSMPSYQYFVVVLAKEVSRYGFLKVTDTVRAPWEEEFDEASAPHYQVVLADATKTIPLSDNALAWTSIAYLVWDEVDPARMSAEQQEALLDWLHWGGRILVNGPDSLATLRGSFLDAYLPAENTGPRTITAKDLRPWSNFWSSRSSGKQVPTLEPKQPWSGIRLKPRAGARELAGGAGLFYERALGQGSIVVSAIQLAERDFINWPGYDGFLNAALLRRPHRQFSEGAYGGPRVDWADYREQRLDAHLTTGLRLFARDAASKANWKRVETSNNNQLGVPPDTTVTEVVDRPGGMAAWSEESPLSVTARKALEEATAVRVPGAGFVVTCLAVYLIVLVPFNWMVFRALRRVEWAWIAAPVIALLGTWALMRLVQLDIGFVRSQTEIALLELQGSYERGLLTRYTGLYSSLSTTYEVAYEDPTTLAMPFPSGEKDPLKLGDRSLAVVFEKQRKRYLRGLTVSSVSRRTVRSEQMFLLEGALRLGTSSRGQAQVENRSGFHLRDVVVVHRSFQNGQTRTMGSWIGDLRSGNSAVLGHTPIDLARIPFAEERREAANTAISDRLKVEAIVKLALHFPESNDPLRENREEHRLVGIIDQVLPGTEVRPATSQTRGATVVLAHLQYGDPPEPQPDVNSRTDVVKEKPRASDD